MAHNTIWLTNPIYDTQDQAYVGFSWTTLFFGPLPLIFRGAWKWFFISLILFIITSGVSNLIMMFIINQIHLNDLIKSGFRATGMLYGELKYLDVPKMED